MKISEVKPDIVAAYIRVDNPKDECEIIEDVIMPAALAHMEQYTGLSRDKLDGHEDLAVAYLALCSFLYDNRSMTMEADKENRVIRSFLDGYQVNLLPTR